MIFFAPMENLFSNSLKLKNYRWYVLSTEIVSSVISIASNVTTLTFNKQDIQINIKQ